MKKVTLLFIQGGAEGAWEADEKLVSYLKKTIGKHYRIEYPRMPDEDDPNYEKYKSSIETAIDEIKGDPKLSGILKA